MQKVGLLAALTGIVYMPFTWALSVDGKLDEREWQQAKVFEQYVQSFPNTGEAPTVKTKTLLWANEDGLYVGFINEQGERSRKYSGHDQFTSSDFNMVFVDFDADGTTAYEFVATLGGGTMDGIYSRGNNSNRDWDGPWRVAVSEDEQYWYSEFFIPWTIATFAHSLTDKREISVYFQRNNVVAGEQYSFPDTHRGKKRFTYEFAPVEVAAVQNSSWYVSPYLSYTQDFLNSDADTRLGVDFSWKPAPNAQFIATINPDFGQVESDELVVNFSAIETLKSDKRPFFTENQSLFDVRGPESLRFLNTRRMGGNSQLESGRTHDIEAAVKYIYNAGDQNFGVLAVSEKDAGLADGKQFISARWTHATDDFSIGQLVNYVDKADGNRSWLTNFDSQLKFDDAWSLNANVFATKQQLQSADKAGFGATAVATFVPLRHWASNITLIHLDDELDLNSSGYAGRANMQFLQFDSQYDDYQFTAQSNTLRKMYYGRATYSENLDGDVLNKTLFFKYGQRLKSKHEFQLSSEYTGAVTDDIISRGYGNITRNSRKMIALSYISPSPADVTFDITASRLQEGVTGWASRLDLGSKLYFGDPVRLDVNASYLSSDDWLYGSAAGQVGQYSRELRQLSLKLVAQLAENADFSFIAQWFGLKAKGIAVLDAGIGKCCSYNGQIPTDFSSSQLSLQARLSYKLNQNSTIYMVAGRGGRYADSNGELSFSQLMSASNSEPFQHYMTIKMSYQL